MRRFVRVGKHTFGRRHTNTLAIAAMLREAKSIKEIAQWRKAFPDVRSGHDAVGRCSTGLPRSL